jgi:hypothetical protein
MRAPAGSGHVVEYGHSLVRLPRIVGRSAVAPRGYGIQEVEVFVCAKCKVNRHCHCVSLRCQCPRCNPATPAR